MIAKLREKDVVDGLAHTYLIGEKYLNPDSYTTGRDAADDFCIMTGAQNDTTRLCSSTTDPNGVAYCQPKRDRAGATDTYSFGSAHADSFNMIMCDGSAHSVAYGIDMELHRRLGNRKDKMPVEMDMISRDATP
jgi:hypothetical protein